MGDSCWVGNPCSNSFEVQIIFKYAKIVHFLLNLQIAAPNQSESLFSPPNTKVGILDAAFPGTLPVSQVIVKKDHENNNTCDLGFE
jgi:hypothetical protein